MTSPAVLAAAEQVHAAWTNAGPAPFFHAAWQIRLVNEWPTLGHALVQLGMVLDLENYGAEDKP
jgi:hypothetical protein